MAKQKGIGRSALAALAVVLVVAAAVAVYAVTRTASAAGYVTVVAQDPGPISGILYVYVEASQIQLHSTNGSWITVLGQSKWVKLNYVLNTTSTFASAKVPAGSYDMVRIVVPPGGVKITVNTSLQPLPGVSASGLVNVSANVPSGAETGIKIYANFTVKPGASYTLILHFHLVETGKGSFLLTPQTNATVSQQAQAAYLIGPLSAAPAPRPRW